MEVTLGGAIKTVVKGAITAYVGVAEGIAVRIIV